MYFNLHSCIFLCGHLVSLELHGCDIPSLPTGFAGFPSLKQLDLTNVRFLGNGENQAEAIIRQSPLLDVLKLPYVLILREEEWVIQAPNLRTLTIISFGYFGCKIGELPRLRDATTDLQSYAEEQDFGKFLAGFAHVMKLTLATCYEPYVDDNLLETLPCTFDNLRTLFLWTHFREMHAILSTFSLLRNAPNLKEFEIEIHGDGEQEVEANAEFQNAQWTDGLCAGLQVVKMNGLGCLSNEMCFIELVLSRATALRTMSLSLGARSSKSNENALSEFITYRRASPHAQVFFKGSGSTLETAKTTTPKRTTTLVEEDTSDSE